MVTRLISILLLGSIILAGCGGSPSQTRGLVNERNSQATYETMDCPFDVPEGFQVNASCGLLEVPEKRGESGGPVQAESKTVKMAVSVVKARAESPRKDPILVLFFDPGSELEWSWVLGYFFEELNAERDLVAVDLRGLGVSQPSFDCPELSDTFYDTLNLDPFSAEVQDRSNLVAANCYQGWVGEGFDLASFGTPTLIADLEELRIALGYKQWNVFASGYGSNLALGLMRDYPDSVRSVVMDSFEPVTADQYLMIPNNEKRILDQFFARCAQDEQCSGAFPDLERAFYRLVDDLISSPKMLEVPDLESGERRQVLLTGYRFLQYSIVSIGVNHPMVVPQLPRAVSQAAKGNFKDIIDMISNLVPFMGPNAAVGMTGLTNCVEELPLVPPDRFRQAIQSLDQPLRGYYEQVVASQEAYCQVWRDVKMPPRQTEPVESNVPALVLAHHNSPWTAPEWAKEVSSKLRRSTLVDYYGVGSFGWLMDRNTCPHQLATAFFKDPGANLDTACARQEPKILWVTMQ